MKSATVSNGKNEHDAPFQLALLSNAHTTEMKKLGITGWEQMHLNEDLLSGDTLTGSERLWHLFGIKLDWSCY
ncbi:unnamed protein product, partial [Amoebophrya sp. A25]|eukprot:GSA25T00017026001.1